MGEYRHRESVVEYETGWYTGGYDRVEQPDGTTKRYYWAELPPAVVVVAVHDGRVVFVEQYRPTIAEHCLELTAGVVEDGESYAEAGARELEEETGYTAEAVEEIETFWCATGVLRHRRGIVVARGADPTGDPALDDNEFLTVTTVPVDEALERARADPANDATIEALLLADADGYISL
ncbi:MAG: NUDIX hydrolase [Halobacteriaceae archaeon]